MRVMAVVDARRRHCHRSLCQNENNFRGRLHFPPTGPLGALAARHYPAHLIQKWSQPTRPAISGQTSTQAAENPSAISIRHRHVRKESVAFFAALRIGVTGWAMMRFAARFSVFAYVAGYYQTF
jgi:hypothetical protein